MPDDGTNELKTDIALIKKDISQIEKILGKLDSSIEKITSLSKSIAIQERVVENHEKRLDDIDQKISHHHREEEEFRKHLQKQLDAIVESNRQYIDDIKKSNTTEREKHHNEIMSSIETLRKDLKEKNEELGTRISSLEQWRWVVAGASAAVAAIGVFLWDVFFG
jgi:small-conductance mechanosensitive channel